MTNNMNAWVRHLSIAASLAWGLTAQAAPMTTTAQIKTFNLDPGNATFFQNTFDLDDGPTAPNTASGPKTAQQQLTFARFDSSLGTLTGVTFSLNSSFSMNLLLDSTNDDLNSSADAALQLLLSGTGLINDQTLNPVISANCFSPNNLTCTVNPTDSGAFDLNEFFGLAPLSSFTGPGSFDLTAKLTESITPGEVPDNGTLNGTFNGTWNGEASLIYTYEARSIPEPQSLLLVAAALAGVAAIRRRRA